MANLFSGLESLGLGNLSGMQLFEKEKKEAVQGGAKAPVEVKEADLIFEKTFRCKVCDKEFKTKMVRTGKAKLVSQDSDLRPRYQTLDPLKYDAVVCPHCGFAALSRFFNYMTDAQAKLIKENISTNFKGLKEGEEILTYDEAIVRHQLVLANTVVKRAKASEKAYTCLKLAWLLRGKAETLPAETPDLAAVKKALAEQEKDYIANAYEGFMDAFTKEEFPMCGMDEITMTYLVADLGRQVGKYDEALRMVARVLMSKNVGDRIKQKTIDLKELIREEKAKAEGKTEA
ncbi:MAG: DUF2225 domain-containing protein [Lachnospiraceae bacterium]|nr:DUF2225 domain-containing protein [Lachnospiraceae bacterium]